MLGIPFAWCEPEKLDEKLGDKPNATADDLGCGPNCTGNSPIFAALGPFEASLNGEREPIRGWKLDPKSFQKVDSRGLDRNRPISQLRVDGASLSGTLPGVSEMKPSDFVGVRFRMNSREQGDYELDINGVQEVKYYPDLEIKSSIGGQPSPSLPKIWAYHIRSHPVVKRDVHVHSSVAWNDLCPYTERDPRDPAIEANWVVFWKGDRYHPDTGEIYASGRDVGDWFNMSCAGEAGIKMLRTGTGEAVAPSTSPSLRQAVLNMFTAKYCPTPERYTVLGMDLFWDGTTAKLHDWRVRPEAIWNERGAVCLDMPRLRTVNIGCENPPVPCTPEMIAHWHDYGLLRSWTRMDPDP